MENFLVIFAIFLFFLGLYLGKTIWQVNITERVAQIVSCEGYEEKFLKAMGFPNRDSCTQLNIALHKQYIDECLKRIKISNNESQNKKLLDFCVYYSFEKEVISLNSEYASFKTKK